MAHRGNNLAFLCVLIYMRRKENSMNVSLPLGDDDPQIQWLNADCCVHHEEEFCTVYLSGHAFMHFSQDDELTRNITAAMLAKAGLCPKKEIYKTFKISRSTLWRLVEKLTEGGVGALLPKKMGPKRASKIITVMRDEIKRLRLEEVAGTRQTATLLGISRNSVQRVLREEGLTEVQEDEGQETIKEIEEDEVNVEEEPEQVARDVDEEPTEESNGMRAPTQASARLYAQLGMSLDGESEIVFESVKGATFAGVLLCMTAFQETGLLDAARKVYGRLRKAVYGLRATLLVLFFMALIRKPKAESLKGISPGELGDVVGLLRAPEVKTLRRKLHEIVVHKKAHQFKMDMAARWMEEEKDVLGVLYVDGHVKVYHGTRKTSKTYVTQRRMGMPGTTDYWVNDVAGEPVMVVPSPANEAMTKILPTIMEEVEEATGGRKGTLVFDRGGWSPALFKSIIASGWDLLTYRKGKKRKHARGGFKKRSMVIDGNKVTYELSERNTRLPNGLKLREIAKRKKNGEQTIIVTSHQKRSAVLLAHRMFNRWRQENYFQYMKQNFALDEIGDYNIEEDDPERLVTNPRWSKTKKQLAKARALVGKLEKEYGSGLSKKLKGKKGKSPSEVKELKESLARATEKVERLEQRLHFFPKKIPIKQLPKDERPVKLSPERQLFTNVIKSSAYRSETMLLNLVEKHFARSDAEGRAFLKNVFQLKGDIEVNGNDVRIGFEQMSAPRFTKALEELCRELNAMKPVFPESDYRLHYAVKVENVSF